MASASEGIGRNWLRHSPICSRSSGGILTMTSSVFAMRGDIADYTAVDNPSVHTVYTVNGDNGVMAMDDFDRDEFETLLVNAEDQARTESEEQFVAELLDRFDADQFWVPTDGQVARLERIADR